MSKQNLAASISRSLSIFLAFASLFLLSAKPSYADGSQAVSRPRYQRPTTRQYNDRLPPVIPGEEIVTETGQKMKTWSSAGPVPVNRRPTPQTVGNGVSGSGIGVIIDGRDRFGAPPNPGNSPVQPLGVEQ
jgi:hypothetical protein